MTARRAEGLTSAKGVNLHVHCDYTHSIFMAFGDHFFSQQCKDST